MLIRRIKSIKDFGIYKDFKWNGDCPDFEKRNIIYGWNYSGKTTLSRFFETISVVSDDDAKAISFKILIEDERGKREVEVAIPNLRISVFNSDYIERNLHFEKKDDSKIKGLLFDIGEASSEKREQLKDVKKQIAEIDTWLSDNHDYIDLFAKFEKEFSTIAKTIKNDVFDSSIEFTKAHLKRIIENINSSKIESYIISDVNVLAETRSNALAKSPLSSISKYTYDINWEELVKSVNECLSETPTKVKEDELLNSDKTLYDWGKIGLDYYSLHPSITKCAFCGGIISGERINELNRFYSNEAARLRKIITDLVSGINDVKNELLRRVELLISANDLVESCRHKFEELKNRYTDTIGNLVQFLVHLEEVLLKKEEISLFEAVSNIENPNDLFVAYRDNCIELDGIIQSHNEIVSNFQSIKNDAIDKLKVHHIARFLKDRNYFQSKKQKEKQENERQIKEEEKQRLVKISNELQAELHSIAKGQEILNAYIQRFLNRDDLVIDITEDNFFILKRGDTVAHNLSEGEKTAIALSYFLVSLESLRQEGYLRNTIVFIDDPISSLDANHIAQVSALINTFFFESDESGKIIDSVAQLFISTHNFEFFSFLRDANNIKRKKPNSSCAIFMLKRISKHSVDISSLPKAFSNYNSEYLYLFSEIHEYYKNGCPEGRSYMMPNIIRRFLEIYTRIKLPGNKDEIDNRIKILMKGDISELKILHYFSHFTSLERVTKHSEIILQLPTVTEDLFCLLKKDKEHLNSLLTGINEPIIE
ncbi:MAG: AAA family ATPase [Bacteroides sp.]|nr:AAA family ATPase [Bacteroides sp.]